MINRKNRIWKPLWCFLLLFSTALTGVGSATEELPVTERIKEESAMRDFAAQPAYRAVPQTELLACSAPTWEAERTALESTATTIRPTFSPEELEGMMLCPGGMPFGVKFMTEGVTVVGFCDVEADGGRVNPAAEAGLKLRDVILQVNGEPLTGAAKLTEQIESCDGRELLLLCRRKQEQVELRLTPVYCPAEARYKTGIWVRDSGAGIGTVTFVLPDTGAFAGLGHGICDADTGELIAMQRGSVSDVTIRSVVKGEAGAPGELKGYFNPGKTGSLLGNSTCGVWGVFSKVPSDVGEAIPIALRSEITDGEAYILSTLDSNRVERYDVQICNINKDAKGSKCFTVKVTDPDLLAASGGIVQGMSGSPIIQNGKLVGAVTHVLVGDPTTGYGIFIENMLTAVNLPVARAS